MFICSIIACLIILINNDNSYVDNEKRFLEYYYSIDIFTYEYIAYVAICTYIFIYFLYVGYFSLSMCLWYIIFFVKTEFEIEQHRCI